MLYLCGNSDMLRVYKWLMYDLIILESCAYAGTFRSTYTGLYWMLIAGRYLTSSTGISCVRLGRLFRLINYIPTVCATKSSSFKNILPWKMLFEKTTTSLPSWWLGRDCDFPQVLPPRLIEVLLEVAVCDWCYFARIFSYRLQLFGRTHLIRCVYVLRYCISSLKSLAQKDRIRKQFLNVVCSCKVHHYSKCWFICTMHVWHRESRSSVDHCGLPGFQLEAQKVTARIDFKKPRFPASERTIVPCFPE